jgi:hypothetical protein
MLCRLCGRDRGGGSIRAEGNQLIDGFSETLANGVPTIFSVCKSLIIKA